MLEGGIGATQESIQITVKAAFRLIPDFVERSVIIRVVLVGIYGKELVGVTLKGGRVLRTILALGRQVAESSGAVALDFDAGRVGQWDKNLANAHLE